MATNFVPALSTDEICRGQDSTRCLSDDLDNIESSLSSKAAANHTHSEYMTEDDAVDAFAAINHTHSGYASASHTHTDLENAIDALDSGKAASTHTHAQSEITGLPAKLTEIDDAIAALQIACSGEVAPILVASMHLGKLDNNNGAELSSTTRICSDPFAAENGKSYWQVNDKEVNMYVLLYDEDETFLEYLGNFASGAEIAVDNTNAAYMRLSSLIGEYDLTNEFRIYDVDPVSGSSGDADSFTQADADLLYAPINHTHTEYAAADHTHDGYAASDHTHTGYAASDHTHTGYATVDHTHTGYAAANHTHDGYAASNHTHTAADVGAASASHTHTAADVGAASASHTHTAADVGAAAASHTHTASDITGLPSSVDAYSKTESDQRFAPLAHTHADYMTEEDATDAFAAIDHTHTGYAAATHTHSYNDLTDKPTIPEAYSHPASHPASMITGLASVATTGSYDDLTNKPTIPTVPTSLPANGGNADTVDNKHASDFADAGHTHTASDIGAASASHTHTPASIGAATAIHTHTEYAAVNHGHTGYFSSDGGTINGDTNVAGVLKVNGQQAFYNSGTSQTIGTNNATGGTTICCGTNANVVANGANLMAPNVLPRNNGSFTLGDSTYRWTGIYSKSAVNVSSDERMKRDIVSLDDDALAEFIEKLNVVSYNYKTDEEDAKARIGLVAQDVQRADAEIAEFFVDVGEDGMLGLTPANLVFPLIAAVQSLSKRVQELEAK
ncbi:MAG: tail fiber domain-containing protein [Faecousia sp.]